MFGPSKSAERLTYDYLRRRIINGEMVGGTAIRQRDIAAQLGVSRIPVRDALRHLAAEGLVTVSSNRRVVVTSMTLADIAEVFQMRAVLEGLAARIAAPRITPAVLNQLSSVANQLDHLSSNVDGWNAMHQKFHDLVCQQAGMPKLQEELTRLRSSVEPYLRVIISELGPAAKSGRNHKRVLAALRKRDGDLAESAMRNLVLRSVDVLSKFMNNAKDAHQMTAVTPVWDYTVGGS